MNSEAAIVGGKIGACFDALSKQIEREKLTKEDLTLFLEYCENQDTLLPVTNPTLYRNQGEQLIPIGKDRAELLMSLLIHLDKVREYACGGKYR